MKYLTITYVKLVLSRLGACSGDGEYLPIGSPGDSSVDLSASPAGKRRKTSHLPVPLVVCSASTPLDPRLNKSGKEGGGGNMQTSHQVTQAILKSLKALEETVQEQQRIIVDEDELFGKQVRICIQCIRRLLQVSIGSIHLFMNPTCSVMLCVCFGHARSCLELQYYIHVYDSLQVAMVMQRLNSRQKAVAKLRIQQVFLDIEFPPEKSDIS